MHQKLQDYAKKGFKDAFKFDYGAAPSDLKSGTPFATYDLLFEWDHIPNKKEVQDQIDHLWYKYVFPILSVISYANR